MKKVLLTGASGYIGSQLIEPLIQKGYHVVAVLRTPPLKSYPSKQVSVIQADFQKPETLSAIPTDIDYAYYLVHAMSYSVSRFKEIEKEQAENFIAALKKTKVKQIVYLSGLISSKNLSLHLSSRLQVEETIKASGIPYTILRAGIIIGPGSTSFKIIQNLVEKLPVMVAPKWLKSKCQPISIQNILPLLIGVLAHPKCQNQTFDVGGDEVLSYKEMLYGYAKAKGLRRWIISVPILTPRLSSYWLYFVTSAPFFLAMALIDSLKNDAICADFKIRQLFPQRYLSYTESILSEGKKSGTRYLK